jgi:hypothetical protein
MNSVKKSRGRRDSSPCLKAGESSLNFVELAELDLVAVAEELRRRLPELQEVIRRLEESQFVSQATMHLVVNI